MYKWMQLFTFFFLIKHSHHFCFFAPVLSAESFLWWSTKTVMDLCTKSFHGSVRVSSCKSLYSIYRTRSESVTRGRLPSLCLSPESLWGKEEERVEDSRCCSSCARWRTETFSRCGQMPALWTSLKGELKQISAWIKMYLCLKLSHYVAHKSFYVFLTLKQTDRLLNLITILGEIWCPLTFLFLLSVPEWQILWGLAFLLALRLPPSFPVGLMGSSWLTSMLAGRREIHIIDCLSIAG